jgi:hypothetical protein
MNKTTYKISTRVETLQRNVSTNVIILLFLLTITISGCSSGSSKDNQPISGSQQSKEQTEKINQSQINKKEIKDKKETIKTNTSIEKESDKKTNQTSVPTIQAVKSSAPTTTTEEVKKISIKFLVEQKVYETKIIPNQNVYSLMQQLSQQGDFSFKARNYSGMGYFVTEINNKKNDQMSGLYWIYYINGAKAQVGVSQYVVKDGDEIVWKYEKGE